MCVCSTRVVVANFPQFITDDHIRKELSRFGKFASGFRVLSAGFQADAVKHVFSFWRQVFMFLNNNEQQLNVHFKVVHGEGPYADNMEIRNNKIYLLTKVN